MYSRLLFYLKALGFSPNCRGYFYLVWAITRSVEIPIARYLVVSKLYSHLADKFFTTSWAVERSIRYAIEDAWSKGNPVIMEKIFGYSIGFDKAKPTNKQFILTMAEYLRLEMLFGEND